MNGQGIPPDGPTRTSWGLYPAGGDFDADDFEDTRTMGTKGGLGEGINPIMLSSFVDFMIAEGEYQFNGNTTAAKDAFLRGIAKSLDKVESFESLVSNKMSEQRDGRAGTGTVKELFGMDQAAKDNHIAEMDALFDASANQMDVIITEFYIAAWGNGLEAYNMYRRTGFPGNLMPALEVDPGDFPLSFFYPAISVDRNASMNQKAGLTTQVFWQDAGVAAGLY